MWFFHGFLIADPILSVLLPVQKPVTVKICCTCSAVCLGSHLMREYMRLVRMSTTLVRLYAKRVQRPTRLMRAGKRVLGGCELATRL